MHREHRQQEETQRKCGFGCRKMELFEDSKMKALVDDFLLFWETEDEVVD